MEKWFYVGDVLWDPAAHFHLYALMLSLMWVVCTLLFGADYCGHAGYQGRFLALLMAGPTLWGGCWPTGGGGSWLWDSGSQVLVPACWWWVSSWGNWLNILQGETLADTGLLTGGVMSLAGWLQGPSEPRACASLPVCKTGS